MSEINLDIHTTLCKRTLTMVSISKRWYYHINIIYVKFNRLFTNILLLLFNSNDLFIHILKTSQILT